MSHLGVGILIFFLVRNNLLADSIFTGEIAVEFLVQGGKALAKFLLVLMGHGAVSFHLPGAEGVKGLLKIGGGDFDFFNFLLVGPNPLRRF